MVFRKGTGFVVKIPSFIEFMEWKKVLNLTITIPNTVEHKS